MTVSVEEIVILLTRELDLDDGDVNASSTRGEIDNWDSLSHLRICMALEAAYHRRIPLEEVDKLNSVSEIVSFLRGT